ncbi:MAG: MarR family winged helix-turn-helix transcriptional regulator [Bacillota bacterium]
MSEQRVEIGELWRSLNREMHVFMKRLFEGSGLPPMAMFLLRRIDREPGITVVELARRSDTAKSHVSKMTELLERQGLLEKQPDPGDQRLVRLYLTKAARERMADMEARIQEAWQRVIQEVPDGQVADVIRGVRVLLGALEAVNRRDGGEQVGTAPGPDVKREEVERS